MEKKLSFIIIALVVLMSVSVDAADKVVVVPLGKGPFIGKQDITPGTTDQAISKGYHDGTGIVAGDPNLKPENIVPGVTIFGITGSRCPEIVGNVDGTVTYPVTHLMWQQADDGILRSATEAEQYCEDLGLAGFLDWRWPNVTELKSLVVCTNGPATPLPDYISCTPPYSLPTICELFNISPTTYWTSTWGGAWGIDFYFWTVNFNNGSAYELETDIAPNRLVLCVRDT